MTATQESVQKSVNLTDFERRATDMSDAKAPCPLLTTITDMASFFFVLSLATLMMPWLV